MHKCSNRQRVQYKFVERCSFYDKLWICINIISVNFLWPFINVYRTTKVFFCVLLFLKLSFRIEINVTIKIKNKFLKNQKSQNKCAISVHYCSYSYVRTEAWWQALSLGNHILCLHPILHTMLHNITKLLWIYLIITLSSIMFLYCHSNPLTKYEYFMCMLLRKNRECELHSTLVCVKTSFKTSQAVYDEFGSKML